MRFLFDCEVAYTIACTHCDASNVQTYRPVTRGQEVPAATLPNGWLEFNGYPICPKHQVTITAKGIQP